MGSWLLNDGLRWLVVFLWLGANAGLFVGSYLKFTEDKEYYYLRKILLVGSVLACVTSVCVRSHEKYADVFIFLRVLLFIVLY
jgi:hypothetical protein